MKNQNLWGFGMRQVVYGVIGAVLYGAFSLLSSQAYLPGVGNIPFRPAVAILIFFGIAYGPWVGFLAGFLGNAFGDMLAGWGFYWNWNLGNGLMGMIPGLAVFMITNYRSVKDIVKALVVGALGIAVGMAFAALAEYLVSGFGLDTILMGYFIPIFIGHLLVTVIFLPILMVVFAVVSARLGH